MTFNWKPRSNTLHLPKMGSLNDAINQSYTATFGTNRGIVGAAQFEAPQTSAYVQGGRAGLTGDFLGDTLIPLPGRTIEAPLRPFDVATGGGLGRSIQGIYQGARQTPIIGNALAGVEGIVGVLDASNKAARAVLNRGMAQGLVDTQGKMGTDSIFFGGQVITVAEFRQKVMRRWATNEFTGEQMTLEALTARAQEDIMNFGEFRTDENGLVGFFNEALLDPVNIAATVATGGGAAAARGAVAATTRAAWTRATPTLVGRAPWMPRIGHGALIRLRGAQGARAVTFARATDYLEKFGHLGPGPATIGNVLHVAQKIYFPKIGVLRAPRAAQLSQAARDAGVRTGLGMNRATSALAAWQLGGAIQMGAATGAEAALGVINQREYDAETGIPTTAEQPGWLDDIQDMLHAVNNSHPLSENQTYTILALFSPWMQSVNVAFKGRPNSAAYYNQHALHTTRAFRDLDGTTFRSEKDFFTQLGDGDINLGRRIYEWYVDSVDVILARNQFGDFANMTANTIEDIVGRQTFLTKEVTSAVVARRASGALGPRSGADNGIRFYREGFSPNPETRLVRGERTISWNGYAQALRDMYGASEMAAAKGFAHMGSLMVADGMPIYRELIGGMLNRLARLPDDARIPREVAQAIIERNPGLIYMNDFWGEFSFTLGQMLDNTGVLGEKPLLPTEGITVAQVRTHLEELLDEVPSANELFHEPLNTLERKAVGMKQAEKVLTRVLPEDAPHAMSVIRKKFVTIGTHALDMRDKVRGIRNTEFFRNGKARWESAEELVGHFGNKFRRVDEHTFTKDPPRYTLQRVRFTDDIDEGLPETNPEVIVDDGAPGMPPAPRERIVFEPEPGERLSFRAEEAFWTDIGEIPVYIFRPSADEAYMLADNLPIDPDKFIDARETGGSVIDGEAGYQIVDTDKWYAARADGYGNLVVNQGFDTAKQAADYVHTISDERVSVRLEDGVITITGRVEYPEHPVIKKEPVYDTDGNLVLYKDKFVDPLDSPMAQRAGGITEYTDRAIGNQYAFMESEILLTVREEWIRANKKRTPFTVTHEDHPKFRRGSEKGDRTYYFIGEDGLPGGMLRLEREDSGAVAALNVYFDPKYRGNQEYGRPFDMVYDQAFIDGEDLSQVSGTNTTTMGRRATGRHWSTRRDTLDTEALDLSIKHGGRIIEIENVPLKESEGMRPISYRIERWDDNWQSTMDRFEVDHRTVSEARPVRMYATDDADNLVFFNEDLQKFEVRSIDDVENLTVRNYDNFTEAVSRLTSTNVSGGWVHGPTLARWGFEEVAVYGNRRVFAYRGGDPNKARINSRVKSATLEYKPTSRKVKTRAAALNIARKRANDASLAYPSLETLGPGYSASRKFFSAQERRAHLNELSKSLEDKATSSAESVQYVDDALAMVSGLEKVTDINSWWDQATPAQVQRMTDTVKEINAEYPALQVVDGGIFIDPRQERFGHLLTGYSTMARHLYDYGFLSPISRFYDAMFVPKHARALQKDVYAELRVHTALAGMTAEQTQRFMEGVRQRVSESRSARGLGNIVGLHKSRNIRALDESTLRVLVQEAAGQEVLDRILARHITVQKMVSEAANGLLRRSARRSRHGGKVSKLEAAANTALRIYQYGDGVSYVSDATHAISKFWYPLIRFTADPLFVMMNLIEPYVYGITRNGVQKMRHQRGQMQQEINKRAVDRASRHSIPAGGFAVTEELPIEMLMSDAGVFSIPRNMRSSIEAEHQIARMDSYQTWLKDIPANDPLAILFQERFGSMDPKMWADQMDELMYGWMNEGPETTVMSAFKELTEEHGFTKNDLQIMAPFMQRLSEMHRAAYDDLADLYVGRLNRMGIERFFDNFWLMWPLSYQIKATKWLASIMFYKIGGVRTGPLGAIMLDEYRNRFMRAVENDPELQAWLQDNRDFLFLLEMMMPMSPESIGISLNKSVRMAGSWLNSMTIASEGVADVVGDYDYIESVPEAIENSVRFGPIRTYNMFRRLMGQLELPGFQYGAGGGSGGGLEGYQP